MYRIHPGYLAWTLDGLVEGEIRNEIVVADEVAGDAKVALERMLAALPGSTPPRSWTVSRASEGRSMRVIIIGSGVAGLMPLLILLPGHDVLVITKADASESNTRYAQGGVAVVTAPEDTPASHVADTLVAGAGLSDVAAATVLCEGGPAAVRGLAERGVAFDRTADGRAGAGSGGRPRAPADPARARGRHRRGHLDAPCCVGWARPGISVAGPAPR